MEVPCLPCPWSELRTLLMAKTGHRLCDGAIMYDLHAYAAMDVTKTMFKPEDSVPIGTTLVIKKTRQSEPSGLRFNARTGRVEPWEACKPAPSARFQPYRANWPTRPPRNPWGARLHGLHPIAPPTGEYETRTWA